MENERNVNSRYMLHIFLDYMNIERCVLKEEKKSRVSSHEQQSPNCDHVYYRLDFSSNT